MPHSPRWYQKSTLGAESGEGSSAEVDLQHRTWQTIAQVPGFTRGIDLSDRWRLSASRKFARAPRLAAFLGPTPAERTCGVWVVHIETGQTVGFLRFEAACRDLCRPSVTRGSIPEMLEWNDERLADSYVLPDAALADGQVTLRSGTGTVACVSFSARYGTLSQGPTRRGHYRLSSVCGAAARFPNARYNLGIALGDAEQYAEALEPHSGVAPRANAPRYITVSAMSSAGPRTRSGDWSL